MSSKLLFASILLNLILISIIFGNVKQIDNLKQDIHECDNQFKICRYLYSQ